MSEQDAPLPRRNVILIGGSQGAIPALKALLGGLPADLRAAIAVTIHRSPTFISTLGALLSRHSPLPVAEASHGKLFEQGRVYLAPPDHHLVFRSGAMWLDRGAKQHHVRPAVDPMFSTGAKAYGPRVIGVLLTGNLSDGVGGLVCIKRHGGLSLAQDPEEAEAPSMPQNAITFDDVDAIFRMTAASQLLARLVRGATISQATAQEGATERADTARARPS